MGSEPKAAEKQLSDRREKKSAEAHKIEKVKFIPYPDASGTLCNSNLELNNVLTNGLKLFNPFMSIFNYF